MAKIEKTKQSVQIPIEINDEDKVRILDDLVSLQVDEDDLQEEIEDKKREHKEEITEIQERLNSVKAKIERVFHIAKEGHEIREVECYVRKNFTTDTPTKEYVDDDDNVLHSVMLSQEEYQITIGEMVVGEPIEPEYFEKD